MNVKTIRGTGVIALLMTLSLVGCALPPAATRGQPTRIASIGRAVAPTTAVEAPVETPQQMPVDTPIDTPVAAPVDTPTSEPTAAPTPRPRVRSTDGLRVVAVRDLPREAQHTIKLILEGGPFPYSRDGVVYQNRERQLPSRSSGYYHEYTVVTPGASDRGARRIIAGEGNELYYTADHYASFVRVSQP